MSISVWLWAAKALARDSVAWVVAWFRLMSAKTSRARATMVTAPATPRSRRCRTVAARRLSVTNVRCRSVGEGSFPPAEASQPFGRGELRTPEQVRAVPPFALPLDGLQEPPGMGVAMHEIGVDRRHGAVDHPVEGLVVGGRDPVPLPDDLWQFLVRYGDADQRDDPLPELGRIADLLLTERRRHRRRRDDEDERLGALDRSADGVGEDLRVRDGSGVEPDLLTALPEPGDESVDELPVAPANTR